jgi:hypothetical protein
MLQLQLQPVTAAVAPAGRANVFAPACHLHEMIDSVLFTTSRVGNSSLVGVLGAWYNGDISEVFMLDGHEGVRGGDECGYDPATVKLLAAIVSTGI